MTSRKDLSCYPSDIDIHMVFLFVFEYLWENPLKSKITCT
jgi:hypothetical protein